MASFSDDFNRGDASSLGPNWVEVLSTANEDDGTAHLLNNRSYPSGAAESYPVEMWAVPTTTLDQCSEIDATVPDINGGAGYNGIYNGYQVLVRGDDSLTLNTYYALEYYVNFGDNGSTVVYAINLYRSNANVNTLLVASGAVSSYGTHKLRIEVVGTDPVVLTCYVDDVEVISYSDSDGSRLSTGSYVGHAPYEFAYDTNWSPSPSGASPYGDNWSGGDLNAPPSGSTIGGAVTLDNATSTGIARHTRQISGAQTLAHATSTGIATHTRQIVGAQTLAHAVSTGIAGAVTVRTISGACTLADAVSVGVAVNTTQISGAQTLTHAVSTGVATITRQVAGAQTLAHATSTGVATAGSPPTGIFTLDFTQADGDCTSLTAYPGALTPRVTNNQLATEIVQSGSLPRYFGYTAHGLTLTGDVQIDFDCHSQLTIGGGGAYVQLRGGTGEGWGLFAGNATHIYKFPSGGGPGEFKNNEARSTVDSHLRMTYNATTKQFRSYLDGVEQPNPYTETETVTFGDTLLVEYYSNTAGFVTTMDNIVIRDHIDLSVPSASLRKGVGEAWDGFTTADNVALNVSWFYDWLAPNSEWHVPDDNGVEYIPMQWGDWEVNYGWDIGGAPGTYANPSGILLGFNEPDSGGQSNVSVARALALWPQLEATGARLGSPVAAPGGQPWIASFMSGNGGPVPRVDFMCVHWYPGYQPETVGELLDYYHTTYGLPIWLTEACSIAGGVAANAALMPTVMDAISTRPWVERVAWFSSRDTDVLDTGIIDAGGALNAAGVVWASYPAGMARVGGAVTLADATSTGVATHTRQISGAQTLAHATSTGVATHTRQISGAQTLAHAVSTGVATGTRQISGAQSLAHAVSTGTAVHTRQISAATTLVDATSTGVATHTRQVQGAVTLAHAVATGVAGPSTGSSTVGGAVTLAHATSTGVATMTRSVGRDQPYLYSMLAPLSRASTPDSPDFIISGDCVITAKMSFDVLNSGPVVYQAIGQTGNSQGKYAWRFSTYMGNLYFQYGNTGQNTDFTPGSVVSVAALGAAVGQEIYVGVKVTANTGGGFSSLQGIVSTDGVTWNSIGSPNVAGVSPTGFDSTAAMTVGSDSGTPSFPGRIYWGEMRTGLVPGAGTLKWRFDASEWVSGTSWVGSDGRTWTLSSAAGLIKSNEQVVLDNAVSTGVAVATVQVGGACTLQDATSTGVAIVTRQAQPRQARYILPNTTCTTPDDPAFHVNTDFVVTAKISLPDPASASIFYVYSQRTTGVSGISHLLPLNLGQVLPRVSTNGTASTTGGSTGSFLPWVSANIPFWVGYSLDINNGAGGHTFTGWVSNDDGETWIDTGTLTIGSVITQLFNSPSAVGLGVTAEGGASAFPGRIYSIEMHEGLAPNAGPLKWRCDPDSYESGTTFGTTHTWTVAAPASIGVEYLLADHATSTGTATVINQVGGAVTTDDAVSSGTATHTRQVSGAVALEHAISTGIVGSFTPVGGAVTLAPATATGTATTTRQISGAVTLAHAVGTGVAINTTQVVGALSVLEHAESTGVATTTRRVSGAATLAPAVSTGTAGPPYAVPIGGAVVLQDATSAGDYLLPAIGLAFSADSPDFNITTDTVFTARVRLDAATATANQFLATQRTTSGSGIDHYTVLINGNLAVRFSITGSGNTGGANILALAAAQDGVDIYLGWKIDIDNDAGGHSWTGLFSLDGITWSDTVTNTITGAITATFDSPSALQIGRDMAGSAASWMGRIYWIEERVGLVPGEGALKWRFDAADHASGTTFVGGGRTWTLTNANAIVHEPHAVVTRRIGGAVVLENAISNAEPYYLPLVGQALTPDRPEFLIDTDVVVTAKVTLPDVDATQLVVIATQRSQTSGQLSFEWGITNGLLVFRVSTNGTSFVTNGSHGSVIPYVTDGEDFYVGSHIDLNNGANCVVTGLVSLDGVNWTVVGSITGAIIPAAFDSPSPLAIGRRNATGATEWPGRIYWAEMREGLTPGEGTLKWRFDAAEAVTAPTWTDPRGLPWSIPVSGAIIHSTAYTAHTVGGAVTLEDATCDGWVATPHPETIGGAVTLEHATSSGVLTVTRTIGTPILPYAYFPAVATAEVPAAGVTTPDTPDAIISGDMVFTAYVTRDQLNTGAFVGTIVGQNGSVGQYAWRMMIYSGGFFFQYTNDGNSVNLLPGSSLVSPATMAASFEANVPFFIGAKLTANTGGGFSSIQAITSDDGITWTDLDIARTSAPSPTGFDGNQPIRIGTEASSFNSRWGGKVFWVEARAGLVPGAGALKWRFDARDRTSTATNSWTDPQGKVWTVAPDGRPLVPRTDPLVVLANATSVGVARRSTVVGGAVTLANATSTGVVVATVQISGDCTLQDATSTGHWMTPLNTVVTTADSPDFLLNEDCVVFAKINPSFVAGNYNQFIFTQRTTASTGYGYLMFIGNGLLKIRVSTNGTSSDGADSMGSIIPHVQDDGELWVGFKVDVDNGAGGRTYTGIVSDDGVTWNNLAGGITIAGVLASSFDSPAQPRIGTDSGTPSAFSGRIASMEMRTGFDPNGGELRWRFDAAEAPPGATSWVGVDGRTWVSTNGAAIVHPSEITRTHPVGGDALAGDATSTGFVTPVHYIRGDVVALDAQSDGIVGPIRQIVTSNLVLDDAVADGQTRIRYATQVESGPLLLLEGNAFSAQEASL